MSKIKVELLVARVGAEGSQNRGEVIEVSAGEAERMIAAGQCIPAQSKKKTETREKKAKTEKR